MWQLLVKCHNSQCPSSFFPQLTCWTGHLRCGIPLWLAGVSCPDCAPSQHLVHPQPAHCGVWGEAGKALRLCKLCLARAKIFGSYYTLSITNQTTVPYQLLWRKLSLPQHKLAYQCNCSFTLLWWCQEKRCILLAFLLSKYLDIS